MRKIGIVIGVVLLVSGCAGVELGGKLGLYRVDERADRSNTYAKQTKPFRCLFVECGNGTEVINDK